MNTSIHKSLTLLSLLALIAMPIWALATTYGTPITINNPTPVEYDRFGYSLSISGDKVLIGAVSDNTGATSAGSAYLFDATTGTLLHTFNNPTPENSDYFGFSVSISGDKVLIGARLDDTGATDAGSAYLFDATTGTLLHTFNNPTPAAGDQFGNSVSISGDKVLIAAPKADSAYLFDATTGVLLQTFNNPSLYSGNDFGTSVSLSGDKVLVGVHNDDTGALNAGSAYLFDATTGALLHAFNNPTPEFLDLFGLSVSVSGDKVLIGAERDDTAATDAGSAYLYDATTGALLQTFNSPSPTAGGNFGSSVSLSGDTVVIGASLDNSYTGSVYVYLPFIDTDGDGIADSNDNCPADANADQTDTDGDGEGDICDFTPNGDTDGDGVDNLVDNCPGVYNPGQEDNDADDLGNVCDPTPDGDPDPNPTSIDQCKQLGWIDFGFRNQGQCVSFVNTGHDSR